MILNAYSVLAAFVGILELGLGAFVAILSARALRRRRGGASPGEDLRESHLPLLLLAAGALLVVSVAAWPLLYLLLDSYVPQWEDVMCIQGVVRIGTGSAGPAGWMPLLVAALQVTKPLLVFAMGTALVVHLANRRTTTAPLSGRLLATLVAAGALAVLDAGVELAYLAIPKEDPSLSRGCCTLSAGGAETDAAQRGDASTEAARALRTRLLAGFGFAMLSMAGWTWYAARRSRGGPTHARRGTLALFLAALATLPLGVIFLREVAAPAFLGLPEHHCAYCLVTSAPLGLLDIGLFLLGVFATCWACLLRWLAGVDETQDFLPSRVASLLCTGLFGWMGAALLTSVRLAIA